MISRFTPILSIAFLIAGSPLHAEVPPEVAKVLLDGILVHQFDIGANSIKLTHISIMPTISRCCVISVWAPCRGRAREGRRYRAFNKVSNSIVHGYLSRCLVVECMWSNHQHSKEEEKANS